MVDSVKEYNYTSPGDYHVYITTVYSGTGKGIWIGGTHWVEIPWTKYQIKESDFRVKTATLTSPTLLDLTTGQKFIKLVSTKHENFMGTVLDDDYTENKDGTYSYKLQDMSRQFMRKIVTISTGTVDNYRLLQSLLTGNQLGHTAKITSEVKQACKEMWSGLRAKYKYAGSYMGNPVGSNLMENKPKLIIRNATVMDAIRAICYSSGYIDLYFDDNGILQLKPINLEDWRNTGLRLSVDETSSRQFKFDTTNSITRVLIGGETDTQLGTAYDSSDMVGLDLSAFFGYNSTYVDNPNKQSSSGSKTTKATKNTNNQTNTNTAPVGKNGNPFNNKPKRIIVSADNGSDSFRTSIINLLKKDGWSVTDLGTGSDQHSRSYDILDSKYAVNLTIYNGMCAGTIKECYDGWLKGKHEKYGVALVMMWDTHSWTSKKGKNNPKGDWYHRNGDMSDYYLAVAHDWGNGGNPTIPNVEAYFKKYKILYCCGTTPANAYAQFKAGGYARMKGLY